MEGTNGIETARILRRADPDLLLVFVTSSPEYVWDAFPVHPFDYLLKPYRKKSSSSWPTSCGGCSSGRTGAGSPHRTAAGTSPPAEDTVRHGPEPLRPHRQRRRRVPDRLHLLPGGAAAAGAGELHRLQPGRHPEHGQGAPAGQRLLRDAGRTRLPVRQKDKNTLFAQFTQYQFRHMRWEL